MFTRLLVIILALFAVVNASTDHTITPGINKIDFTNVNNYNATPGGYITQKITFFVDISSKETVDQDMIVELREGAVSCAGMSETYPKYSVGEVFSQLVLANPAKNGTLCINNLGDTTVTLSIKGDIGLLIYPSGESAYIRTYHTSSSVMKVFIRSCRSTSGGIVTMSAYAPTSESCAGYSSSSVTVSYPGTSIDSHTLYSANEDCSHVLPTVYKGNYHEIRFDSTTGYSGTPTWFRVSFTANDEYWGIRELEYTHQPDNPSVIEPKKTSLASINIYKSCTNRYAVSIPIQDGLAESHHTTVAMISDNTYSNAATDVLNYGGSTSVFPSGAALWFQPDTFTGTQKYYYNESNVWGGSTYSFIRLDDGIGYVSPYYGWNYTDATETNYMFLQMKDKRGISMAGSGVLFFNVCFVTGKIIYGEGVWSYSKFFGNMVLSSKILQNLDETDNMLALGVYTDDETRSPIIKTFRSHSNDDTKYGIHTTGQKYHGSTVIMARPEENLHKWNWDLAAVLGTSHNFEEFIDIKASLMYLKSTIFDTTSRKFSTSITLTSPKSKAEKVFAVKLSSDVMTSEEHETHALQLSFNYFDTEGNPVITEIVGIPHVSQHCFNPELCTNLVDYVNDSYAVNPKSLAWEEEDSVVFVMANIGNQSDFDSALDCEINVSVVQIDGEMPLVFQEGDINNVVDNHDDPGSDEEEEEDVVDDGEEEQQGEEEEEEEPNDPQGDTKKENDDGNSILDTQILGISFSVVLLIILGFFLLLIVILYKIKHVTKAKSVKTDFWSVVDNSSEPLIQML